MRKCIIAIALFLISSSAVLAWSHGSPPAVNFQQQNFFGLTGSAWLNTSQYYVPGTGNPAISTADYYHLDGVTSMRPYDLLNPDCGTAGSTIAASRGRYIWIMSVDHPSPNNFSWQSGIDFRAGYSNDPGAPPFRVDTIIPFTNVTPSAQIATLTASISGTTLTVTAVAGTISFDNNAVLAGTGVTVGTQILSQLSGTSSGIGTYSLSASSSVGSESMTLSQQSYHLYQNPFFVCNPDDASFPFYLFAEGSGSRVQHEEGLVKSSDLLSWTTPIPSHITPIFNNWTSYERPIRDGVNSWHSTGFQGFFPVATALGWGFWTGAIGWTGIAGQFFTPNPTGMFNTCLPPNSTGVVGANPCPDSPALLWDPLASPDTITTASRNWAIGRISNYVGGTRTGNQWVSRIPIDANFNLLASPPPVNISPAYNSSNYPGPAYLQAVNAYVEDGIGHYYAQTGFFPSDTVFNLVNAATYANGGGLWQQGLDYYTEILDPVAAANAAPVGVAASCASSVVTLTWYDVLPQRTYRVYRGTTAGSQTTLIGDVTGLTMTDGSATSGSVYYYKVVTLNAGVEKKSRVISTYVSPSVALVNAHITRVLAAGADPTTINRTWLDSFASFLFTNGLTNNLQFATMTEFGIAQSATVISKIFDLGTTRLPRGGDYTTTGTSTTYSATGLGGAPAWLNGNTTAQGYYGGGIFNNIRRKTQVTAYAIYQKPNTINPATLIAMGQGVGMALYHSAGAPGAANFALSDATQTKTATATISGSATILHSIAGTFDGTTLLAYADAVAGTGVTGLVIPSPNLNPPDALTGSVGNSTNMPFLGSGSQSSTYTYGTGYVFNNADALFNGGALIVFDKALTPTQISSLDALMKAHF